MNELNHKALHILLDYMYICIYIYNLIILRMCTAKYSSQGIIIQMKATGIHNTNVCALSTSVYLNLNALTKNVRYTNA